MSTSSIDGGSDAEDLAPFGAYKPNRFLSLLIRWARSRSNSRIGRETARLLRRIALPLFNGPVDLQLEGMRLRLYVVDNQAERTLVFIPGSYEKRERDLLAEVLPADAVFVDIGANVGLYAASLARTLGAEGRVVALEPNPAIFSRLSFNVGATLEGLPSAPGIRLLQQGISDQPGEFELSVDATDAGKSHMRGHPESGGTSATSVVVSCLPLLSLLDQEGITRPDAIKIDIEGLEDRALIPYLTAAPDERLASWILLEENQHLWQTDLFSALEQRAYRVDRKIGKNVLFRRG